MMSLKNILFGIILSILLFSCNNNPKESKVQLNFFYKDIYYYEQLSEQAQAKFKNKYKDVFDILYNGNNSDSLISVIPSSEIYKVFIDDIEKQEFDYIPIINNISELIIDIKEFTHLNINNKFNIVITPYNQSVTLTDSICIIGINHYLGANHPLYQYFDEYKRKNKEPNRIIYDIADVYCRSIIRYSNNNSLLDNIIREGLILTLESIVLDSEPFQILNFSSDDITWIDKYKHSAWNTIIGNDLLYSSSTPIINDIINPAPKAYSINNEAPALIGRLFGYEIIFKYLKESDLDLNFTNLKNITKLDSKTILLKSKYNGYK